MWKNLAPHFSPDFIKPQHFRHSAKRKPVWLSKSGQRAFARRDADDGMVQRDIRQSRALDTVPSASIPAMERLSAERAAPGDRETGLYGVSRRQSHAWRGRQR